MKIIELNAVDKRYGGVHAVRGVSFAVESGQLTGLIGPNGAGKTTLFNIIAGTVRQDSGEVIIYNYNRRRSSPDYVAARLGVGRSFQGVFSLPELSVIEHFEWAAVFGTIVNPINLLTASWNSASKQANRRESENIVDLLGLRHVAHEKASDLPYGLQKLVGIGVALANKPKVLLADEPAAGLNDSETAELQKVLLKLHHEMKIDILLIEHNMKLVTAVCDRVIVLADGVVIADDTPEQIIRNQQVIDIYLGNQDYV